MTEILTPLSYHFRTLEQDHIKTHIRLNVQVFLIIYQTIQGDSDKSSHNFCTEYLPDPETTKTIWQWKIAQVLCIINSED